MGDRLRAFDWYGTGLGEPESWPAPLRSAMSICLSSSFPTCVYWGADLRLLYNDAWSLIPADRHPGCLGQPAREVWRDIWDVVGPQLQQVIDTGRGFSAYDQLLPMERGGTSRETYWTYSFTPLFDEHENVVGILNQGHETTAAVIGERSRKSEVARLRELFEQAPGAVALLHGPAHVFELANAAYLELIGNRPVIGRAVAEALPEVAAQGFVALLDRVYATGLTYKAEAAPVALKRSADSELEERVLDFIYQPLRDPAGGVTGIFVQATDVTERHRAVKELVAGDRRKDVFLATLAHELRNPLAPIRNGLQLLKLSAPPGDRLAQTRDMMERQLRHLVHLVDDLMDVSRISTGKIQLRREPVAVRDVLKRAIESTSTAFERKSQNLETAIDDATIVVDGDAERLSQVFANLLGNATKFTPERGHVKLSLRRQANRAEVIVEDDGIGIPEESLQKVFELFAQVPRPQSTEVGGLGIGLALVMQLVGLHGGSVSADSPGPGRGSRFTVHLPLTRM
ncbi:MAG: HAMP domain-containing sensor histidine kinase [Steroidobacteraceae bacterium]